MDYRELLKKYIKHVEHEEGTDFLPYWLLVDANSPFSQDEFKEIYKVAVEAGTRDAIVIIKDGGEVERIP